MKYSLLLLVAACTGGHATVDAHPDLPIGPDHHRYEGWVSRA